MSEQDGRQAPIAQRPANEDKEAWKAYWQAQNQPWRTEPEIDAERQRFLTEHCRITPNIEQGIYPLKDIKLSRANVEWLLATHENGRGPIDWSDGSQQGLVERKGLDLRGADLQFINLSRLPLTKMRGGLTGEECLRSTADQREIATIHLEGTNLRAAHLEGSTLSYAHLEGANLHEAHLEGAFLSETHFEGANLREVFFTTETQLINIFLGDERFGFAFLADVRWGDTNLAVINWASIKKLGDESEADRRKKDDEANQLLWYRRAVRANRQLAVALQGQGLNEEAARFAYRAQRLQRIVLQRQKKFGSYLFSVFLDLVAGYRY